MQASMHSCIHMHRTSQTLDLHGKFQLHDQSEIMCVNCVEVFYQTTLFLVGHRLFPLTGSL